MESVVLQRVDCVVFDLDGVLSCTVVEANGDDWIFGSAKGGEGESDVV